MSNFEGLPSILKIRPHHGLCMQFFRGEGYSAEFVRHMREVITALHRGASVELTDGTDSICAACPNNHGGVCNAEDKVRRFDRGVLEACGLSMTEPTMGRVLDGAEFRRIVQEHIIERGLMKTICGDCEWARICHEG